MTGPAVRSVAGCLIALALGACSASGSRPDIAAAGDGPAVSSAPVGSVPAMGIQGKYEQPDLAVSRDGRAVAWLHGYVGKRSSQLAWLDRTADAETWHADKARKVGHQLLLDSDSYEFVTARTVVAFGGSRGLWVSHDAGASWQERLGARLISAVARTGRKVWLVTDACRSIANCPGSVLESDVGLTQFHAPFSQPGGGGLIRSGVASGGVLAVLRGPVHGAEQVSASTDGGRTWMIQRAPCANATDTDPLTAAGGTLWLGCIVESFGHGPAEGLVATYRSIDGGRHWINMTGRRAGVDDLSIYPVSRLAAWGLRGTSGERSLVRTTDGGAHWTAVRTPWPVESQQEVAAYLALAPVSAQRAWALAELQGDGGTSFEVYRTADDGRTWTSASLPIAPNLPAAAQSSPPGA